MLFVAVCCRCFRVKRFNINYLCIFINRSRIHISIHGFSLKIPNFWFNEILFTDFPLFANLYYDFFLLLPVDNTQLSIQIAPTGRQPTILFMFFFSSFLSLSRLSIEIEEDWINIMFGSIHFSIRDTRSISCLLEYLSHLIHLLKMNKRVRSTSQIEFNGNGHAWSMCVHNVRAMLTIQYTNIVHGKFVRLIDKQRFSINL